jgi:hypothetical protein
VAVLEAAIFVTAAGALCDKLLVLSGAVLENARRAPDVEIHGLHRAAARDAVATDLQRCSV